MRSTTVRVTTTRHAHRPAVSRALPVGPLKGTQSAVPAHNGGPVPTTPTDAMRQGREGEAQPGVEEKESVDWDSLGVGAALGAALLI